jgi:hypothetical protein
MLSFDFSKVTVNDGPSINDIPVDTDLYATVDGVTLEEFNGQDKFVLEQTIFIDPTDETKTVNFKTFIGPKHGWLLAQYLQAVGEDFRSLSGQGLSAEALSSVLKGNPLNVRLRKSKYTDRNGEERSSTQITTVKAYTA